MSIKKTFNGASVNKAGAYSKIVVENLTGFPLLPTGTVGIVGEAVGGAPRVLDIISKEQIQSAKTRYKTGPIADALDLLVNGAKDPRVVNGADTIVVYKTNNSTQSQGFLQNGFTGPFDQVQIDSKNYGSDENNLSVALAVGSVVDAQAQILGSVAENYNLAGGETLILNCNNTVYTFTNTVVGAAVTATQMINELNTAARWSGSIKPVISSVVSGKVKILLDINIVGTGHYDYGYIQVDPASTIDTILGIVGENRGLKGSRILTVRNSTEIETSVDIGGVDAMSILYTGAGTACDLTLSIVANQMVLSTVCAGAAADNLNFVIRDVNGVVRFTVQQLVDQINATGVYTASASAIYKPNNADELDYYSALDIKNVAANLRRDIDDMVSWINLFSQLVSATRLENVYYELVPVPSSVPTALTGGADGTSANSDFANAFEAFKAERINVVVPLISKDIGPLSIDSINASADAHAAWGWSTGGKSERSAFVSNLASKDALKAAARNLNSGYTSIFGQQVQVRDREGTLNWQDPWAQACLAASIRSGSEVGEPLTFKYANCQDLRVMDGSWDPKKDYSEMIDAGVTFMEAVDQGGFRIVLGNTTYGTDGNFVWNRESVVQASGYVAYDLRSNLETQFTGTKAKTGTAESIANFIKARMSTYLAADIIVGDDLNKKLGYKNLRIVVEGNTANINISITPVQGIDFILPTIFLEDIRQTA